MVTDRGGVIVCHLRPVTDEKSALVHTDEYVLHDVLCGDPVTKDERGYPDEPCPVQPEHLIEATVGICARLPVEDENYGRRWLLDSDRKC